MRPDDILHMYSGRTVEVNNTDAEGRLVLADGVAWAAKNRQPRRIIDVATLTGAQSMSTGKIMAALFCTDAELEAEAVAAGRACGELCHPLPYAPELFRKEFHSQVADMKNSVKDRSNAQASCAGQFIGNHLMATDYTGPWLHVDMAGPSTQAGRGTGYGVALLLTLAGVGAT
jgi:probable aminopeptidase NPEPL1